MDPVKTGRLKPHPAVVFTPLSDQEAVLLHMDNKFYYSLNSTGAYMWKLLEAEDFSEAELAQKIQTVFDLPLDQAKADVNEFITDLVKEQLLEKSSS